MKSRYRNILIGTAVAAVLGVTGAVYAHGGANDGNLRHGAQAQQACGGTGPGKGMMSGGMMGGHGKGMMGGGMMGGHGKSMMGDGMMGGHGMGMMGGMQHGAGFGFGLDLSDEQKAEMGKIRQEILPKMGELHGKMQVNHEQMQALHHSDAVDEAAIATLADQKGELMAEMIKLHSRHRAGMQALLTDEQREQMNQRHQGMGIKGMQQKDG